MNYVLIESGIVVNLIVWDGDVSVWRPPAGMTAIKIPPGQEDDYVIGEIVPSA